MRKRPEVSRGADGRPPILPSVTVRRPWHNSVLPSVTVRRRQETVAQLSPAETSGRGSVTVRRPWHNSGDRGTTQNSQSEFKMVAIVLSGLFTLNYARMI
jgi:hypothetical protein